MQIWVLGNGVWIRWVAEMESSERFQRRGGGGHPRRRGANTTKRAKPTATARWPMTGGAKSLSRSGGLAISSERVWEVQTGGVAPISLGEISDISRRWDRTVDEHTLTIGARKTASARGEQASRYVEAHYERQRRVETRPLRSPKPRLPADPSGAGWY